MNNTNDVTGGSNAGLATARGIMLVLLAAAIGIILVALAFEHIGGYRPCPLCLRQRYAYYFAIVVGLAWALADRGGVRPSGRVLRGLLLVIALAYLMNSGLGIQHAGVEWKWWAGPDTCSAALPKLSGDGPLDLSKPVIRCDEAAWRFAGLSFAGWNAVLSLILMALAVKGVSTISRRDGT